MRQAHGILSLMFVALVFGCGTDNPKESESSSDPARSEARNPAVPASGAIPKSTNKQSEPTDAPDNGQPVSSFLQPAGIAETEKSSRDVRDRAAVGLPKVSAEQVRASEITNSIGMKLLLIPAGEFIMGSPDSDPNAQDFEKPAHRVRTTKPYYIGAYEVTHGQYEPLMSRSAFSNPRYEDYPKDMVSWEAAVEFCQRLSDLPAEREAGRSYRLPTEAEWEYAARAGTRTFFPWGDSLSLQQANYRPPTNDTKTVTINAEKGVRRRTLRARGHEVAARIS